MTGRSFLRRTFQLWEYRVSHGSLLIRSPKGVEGVKNVDIACTGVEYVAVPRFMRGLEIEEPTLAELSQLERIVARRLSASSVVVLASSGQRFVVVAAGYKIDESEMDIFDSPFE